MFSTVNADLKLLKEGRYLPIDFEHTSDFVEPSQQAFEWL